MGEHDFERLPLSRRAFLGLGVGAASAAWLWSNPFGGGDAEAAAVNPFTEPEVITSEDGLLEVTLVCEKRQAVVAGQVVNTYTYNGKVPGPTLVAYPGDKLKITLVNNLPGEMTNLHTHGLHVS